MAVNRLSILKLFELLISVSCLILHYKSMGESTDETILLVAGTFVGYTIILIVLFAGYIMSEPLTKKLDIFLSIVGCALFIACGILIVNDWHDRLIKTEARKLALTKGGLAIVNGVIFLADGFFTFRD